MAKAKITHEISLNELKLFLQKSKEGSVLTIKVKPNASRERIYIGPQNELTLAVSAIPADNRANARVLEILAELFNLPISSLSIVGGHKSRKKRILVNYSPLTSLA